MHQRVADGRKHAAAPLDGRLKLRKPIEHPEVHHHVEVEQRRRRKKAVLDFLADATLGHLQKSRNFRRRKRQRS